MGKSISLHVSTPRSMQCGVDFSKHLVYIFFFILFFIFFNSTPQYTRIIVEYSATVGKSLVWLETNVNPTMTILLFSSILSTKQQEQSSSNNRPVWQCQKSLMSRIQSTDQEEEIFDCQHQNGELARLWWCPDCDSQKVQHQAPSTVCLSCHPTQLR